MSWQVISIFKNRIGHGFRILPIIYTREGWLYLATVLDLYSRAIVGWSMSNRLKAELVKGSVFVTRKQARTEIFDYIEVFYNRKRKHSTLGNKAPFEFENQSTLN